MCARHVHCPVLSMMKCMDSTDGIQMGKATFDRSNGTTYKSKPQMSRLIIQQGLMRVESHI